MWDLDQLLEIQHLEVKVWCLANNLLCVWIRLKRKCISKLKFSIAVIDYLMKALYKWLKLFLGSVRMLLNIIFRCRKFSCIFVLAILKTNAFPRHLYKCNFIQNLALFLYVSETIPTILLKISLHNLHNVYNKV